MSSTTTISHITYQCQSAALFTFQVTKILTDGPAASSGLSWPEIDMIARSLQSPDISPEWCAQFIQRRRDCPGHRPSGQPTNPTNPTNPKTTLPPTTKRSI